VSSALQPIAHKLHPGAAQHRIKPHTLNHQTTKVAHHKQVSLRHGVAFLQLLNVIFHIFTNITTIAAFSFHQMLSNTHRIISGQLHSAVRSQRSHCCLNGLQRCLTIQPSQHPNTTPAEIKYTGTASTHNRCSRTCCHCCTFLPLAGHPDYEFEMLACTKPSLQIRFLQLMDAPLTPMPQNVACNTLHNTPTSTASPKMQCCLPTHHGKAPTANLCCKLLFTAQAPEVSGVAKPFVDRALRC
jgi:hypothetical protein